MPHLAPASLLPGSRGWLADLVAADDDQVADRFQDRDLRRSALAAALAAVAPSGAWSGPHGVVRVEVGLPDGTSDVATVRFDSRGARLVDDGDPDAAIRVPLVPMVRLATGQADGALLYLAGVLQVVGREDLVLDLGMSLHAHGRPLVDAAALDPVAVSRAIEHARLEHLAAVMAGGFRGLVLREVFGRLPEFVIAERAERVRVAVAFEVGGRVDGGVDRYVVRILEGACVVTADAPADEPVDATLELEGHEFLRLVLGHLNPVRGVLSGQVKVRGQVVKALGFNAVMRIPGT